MGTSGASIECTLVSGCWLTDADPLPENPYDGKYSPSDGDLMKNALHTFYMWFFQNPKTRPTLASLQNTIASILTHYYPTDRQKMAVQMTTLACPASDPAKWSYYQVMSFIGIRKQCLEWVITTVAAVPGTVPLNYGSAAAFPVSDHVRPGMGLYDIQHHAMIIVDVLWKNDIPIAFQVAEANYPNYPAATQVWSTDPYGEVPWLREVHLRPSSVRDAQQQPIASTAPHVQTLNNCAAKCIVVNFEPNTYH
jgi:hypothetical protein